MLGVLISVPYLKNKKMPDIGKISGFGRPLTPRGHILTWAESCSITPDAKEQSLAA